MTREQENSIKRGLKTRAHTRAMKLRERLRLEEDHMQGKGSWMGLTSTAMKALRDMDRAEKKLASMGVMLLLPLFMAQGQGIPVVSDTNQLPNLPSGIKVEWRTNLYEAQTFTFVTTNWIPVGPPMDIVTNGVVIARRQHEAATLLTNVFHSITHEGIERRFMVSQTTGPVLATRSYDFPPKIEAPPFLAVPLRQQR